MSIKAARLIKELRESKAGQEAQIVALTALNETLIEQNGTLTTQYEGVLAQNESLQGHVTTLLGLLGGDEQATRQGIIELQQRNGDLKATRLMAEVEAGEARRRARRYGWITFWVACLSALALVAALLYGGRDDAVNQSSTVQPPVTSIRIENGTVTVFEDGVPALTVKIGPKGEMRLDCIKWFYSGGLNAPVTHHRMADRRDAVLKICGLPQG